MDHCEQATFAIALKQASGVGTVTARRLLEKFGSPKNVFLTAIEAPHLLIDFVGKKTVNALQEPRLLDHARAEVEKARSLHLTVLWLGGPGYPKRLLACNDAPVVLFVKGCVDFDASRMIAFVGTRKMTPYGRIACEQLINEMAAYQVNIVSGLAFGIDIIAHRAAMINGLPTIACLAHGLAYLYPGAHARDARRMVEGGGALVSEHLIDTKPSPAFFPERNRVIAGLCDAIVVVESDRNGGSMITARVAASYHREVFAVPGPITSHLSTGTNGLIRTLEAHLLSNARCLASEMGWEKKDRIEKQLTLALELPNEQRRVYEAIKDHRQRHIDLIQADTALEKGRLAVILFELEMAGLIRLRPGQVWECLR